MQYVDLYCINLKCYQCRLYSIKFITLNENIINNNIYGFQLIITINHFYFKLQNNNIILNYK